MRRECVCFKSAQRSVERLDRSPMKLRNKMTQRTHGGVPLSSLMPVSTSVLADVKSRVPTPCLHTRPCPTQAARSNTRACDTHIVNPHTPLH